VANSMDSFNAKRMTADQVARSFVVPAEFDRLSGTDHMYVIGPRGSGKTTMLRMLTGETLSVWTGEDADAARARIAFSSVFVPADELWASQISSGNVRAAFAAQLMLAALDTMTYRTSRQPGVHLPARIDAAREAQLANHLSVLWGLEGVAGGFLGLQRALEVFLLHVTRTDVVSQHPLAGSDSFRLLVPAVEAFNREVGQRGHRWSVLLDEMELAPAEIHRMVTAYVRGGPAVLSLKISMSPFDRFMEFYGDGSSLPAPGNDFDTIYLSGQTPRVVRSFTNGLWDEALQSRNLPLQDLRHVLEDEATSRRDRSNRPATTVDFVAAMAQRDAELRQWLRRRGVNLQDPSQMSYFQSSATVRKVGPLLVYRDALLNFREGLPVKRSRKKSFEPFVGATAITTMLEGNPRWIKSAFAQMLERYDARRQVVSAGFQYDAVSSVASRFEALLRVLPTRQEAQLVMPPLDLVDTIARYLRDRNLGLFSPDAPNGFIVDRGTPEPVRGAILMGLYAGAVVHLRNRRSPAVLSSLTNERFRLTHLLSIRDGKELPLRLGKDVNLSTMLAGPRRRSESALPLEWSQYEGA
jgi:energy-coupling factor transporter ATP-binding protein EcfA2